MYIFFHLLILRKASSSFFLSYLLLSFGVELDSIDSKYFRPVTLLHISGDSNDRFVVEGGEGEERDTALRAINRWQIDSDYK